MADQVPPFKEDEAAAASMRIMTPKFDPECRRLAVHFLGDIMSDEMSARADELASHIQAAIDDYLTELGSK